MAGVQVAACSRGTRRFGRSQSSLTEGYHAGTRKLHHSTPQQQQEMKSAAAAATAALDRPHSNSLLQRRGGVRDRDEGAVETAKIVSGDVAEEGGAEDGDW